MKIKPSDYLVPSGENVDLSQRPTKVAPAYDSKKHYKKMLKQQVKKLSKLQRLYYASNQQALLLIFQGMDTAGKDGAIRHVMSGVNPQGCQVFSFKQPSTEELQHDFLWRTSKCLPERGRIGIFNRSYYEEVLIVRVHPELLKAQGFSDEAIAEQAIWKARFQSITDLEAHLHQNGTQVLKFFLHLSKDEQRARFLARIDKPAKNWKFSVADVNEREHWDDYMRAYEACLSATSTAEAPWFVVPADDKKNARLIISKIVVATLRNLKMDYPKVSRARRRQLLKLRQQL
ncbi:ADP-polyphosphate phosphotransferase [Arsukibacterium sp.]|uniref:ADP-polyphosphate phosphotransferase n=1 Tax=Arsukibacterium sp. TaxID=1977258 RepID=UPI00299E06DC|nr:ADP-polyphosphate phosphotransferase [Arsukibacterium sp.]MDX1676409.1 ADP-polyphosphate phosphotransferase [Arsukibacterium sp.]